jgi:hypothetical protein
LGTLPYVTGSKNIEKALANIKSAAVPERVSQDFVKTILKIPGGSGDQITSFLKKLGFAAGDGRPTELYTKYRNPASSRQALAKAIRQAYAALYVRNEFMHELSDENLLGLVVEETGQPQDSNPVKNIVNCIKVLKPLADFSENGAETSNTASPIIAIGTKNEEHNAPQAKPQTSGARVGLNLGYTINLNLPATSDQAVFNAIFKSLKQNLLSDDDA